MKYREHSKRSMLFWLLCYLALLSHAYSLMSFRAFVAEILVYSLLCILTMCVFYYWHDNEDAEAIDDEATRFYGEKYLDNLMSFILVLPIVVSLIILYYAQINQSYEKTFWWIYALATMVGAESGKHLKYNRILEKFRNNDRK